MSILLETTIGDVVIDLDVEGSPELARNVLKLTKARYYTNTLIYNILPQRYCQCGDPKGNGSGGGCIYGLIDATTNNTSIEESQKRFLKTKGRFLSKEELQQRGRIVATEMNGIPDTIGSQFIITLEQGPLQALDGLMVESLNSTEQQQQQFLSLGTVAEDEDGVLDKLQAAYCDADGRPFADIRIVRALVIHDAFDDPPGMEDLLEHRGVVMEDDIVTASPEYIRPPEEVVEHRIQANEVDEAEEEDETHEKARQREEEIHEREDKSRAVVLEMLGDLPSADIKAPENVLFVCKLNPVTDDEDLELIFSRFDPDVKAEIIRDNETGASLQYAFVEFADKRKCVEAYFKMNNALIDDRRIKVDFSQSVAKVWNKYAQRMRAPGGPPKPPQRNRQQGDSDQRRYNSHAGHQQRRPPHQRNDHRNRGREVRGPPPGDARDRRHGYDGRDQGRDRPVSGRNRYHDDYQRDGSPHSHRRHNNDDDHYNRQRRLDEEDRSMRRSRSRSFDRRSLATSRSSESDRSRSPKRRRKKHHKKRHRDRHRHRHRDDGGDDRHSRRRHNHDREDDRRKEHRHEKKHKRKRKRHSRSRSVSRS